LPLEPQTEETLELPPEGSSRRSLPGSTSFVPGVAGLIMAGEVIKDLCKAK
jgi:tRNA A37 threonylcarbamoyladenosine dehydratase